MCEKQENQMPLAYRSDEMESSNGRLPMLDLPFFGLAEMSTSLQSMVYELEDV
jgi:hypothetical protein